jgi:hypothetical protein
MAILNDDEDQTKNINRSISGGTSYIGGGYAGGAAPDQSPRETQGGGAGPGTGFVNINEYLSGPSGSGRMASGIAGETEQAGGNALKAIGGFRGSADKETAVADFDPNVAGGWLYDASTSGTAPGTTAQFNGKAPDTTYKGPTGFSSVSGYAPAQKATSDVQDRVKNSGTFEGVQGLLAPQVSKGAYYTPGMSKLDAGLTTGGAGADVLQQSQKKWSNIGNFLGQAEGDVQSQIGGAQAKAKAVTAQWQNAENLARQKADETNKYYNDLATRKQAQQIAAMQPGAGAGSYTTPAVVPAPAPAAPSGSKGKSDAERFAERWIKPDTDRMLTPTPGGLSSDALRRSEPGRLSKEAQQGGFYYIKKNPIAENVNKGSEWLTRALG